MALNHSLKEIIVKVQSVPWYNRNYVVIPLIFVLFVVAGLGILIPLGFGSNNQQFSFIKQGAAFEGYDARQERVYRVDVYAYENNPTQVFVHDSSQGGNCVGNLGKFSVTVLWSDIPFINWYRHAVPDVGECSLLKA